MVKMIPIQKNKETKDFPEDWSLDPLYTVSTMNGRIGWQGLKQSEFTQNPDDPFLITGMNFKDGKIRWDEVYHIPTERYDEAKNIQLKKNDILITKDGTIGKLLFIDKIPHPQKASLNSHLLVFRPIAQKYIPKFFFYHLLSKQFLEHIEQNKSGTTFFGITEKAIGKYNVYLPSIPEQTSIAESLSNIDELIDYLAELIEKKKNIKKGTMQELLTGKRRLGGFHEEWPIEVLGKYCTLYVPMRDKPKEFGGSIPWLRIEDLDGKFVSDSKSEQYVTPETVKKMNLVVYPIDTVLCSCSATIGVCAITKQELITNQTFIGMHPNSAINSEFLYYYLQTQTNNLIKIASGSTILYISRQTFEEFPIPLPKLEEQCIIVQILSDMDLEIKDLENTRKKYMLIKNGMMQKLLTGEIRLK